MSIVLGVDKDLIGRLLQWLTDTLHKVDGDIRGGYWVKGKNIVKYFVAYPLSVLLQTI